MEPVRPTDQDTSKKVWAGLALLVLTVVIVGGVVLSSGKARPAMQDVASSDTAATTSTSSANPAPTSTATGSTSATGSAGSSAVSTFKDGNYTATGSYDSPGGTEAVKVSVTLMADKVTASSVQSEANDPTAASYQMNFISGYKQFVIGKDITTIHVSNVSGSSLTSIGFQDALAKIERQAHA